MDDTAKARALGYVLRRVPVPGRHLGTMVAWSSLDLEAVASPLVCRSRWNDVDFCIRRPGDLVERHILLQGYFEYHVSTLIRATLRPGDTALDIGANIGWHTVLAGKAVGPTGRVVAFEPVATTHARLRENIALNGLDNVTTLRCGLSNTAGSAPIYEVDAGNAGGNSLFAESAAAVPLETIALRVGDDVVEELGLERIALAKMDIEGAELLALDGLERTLRRKAIATLLIEVNPDALAKTGASARDLVARLRGYGFRLCDVRQPTREIGALDQRLDKPLDLICRLPD